MTQNALDAAKLCSGFKRSSGKVLTRAGSACRAQSGWKHAAGAPLSCSRAEHEVKSCLILFEFLFCSLLMDPNGTKSAPNESLQSFSHELQVSVMCRCPCCRAASSEIRHPPAQGLPAATLQMKHTISSRGLQLPNQLHSLIFTSGVMSVTLSTHA